MGGSVGDDRRDLLRVLECVCSAFLSLEGRIVTGNKKIKKVKKGVDSGG